MIRKNLIALLLLLSLSAWLGAVTYNSSSAFGVHFGTSTASGYSMRWMGPKNGLQATLGAYTTGSSEPNFSPTTGGYWDEETDPDWVPDDSLITVERGGRTSAISGGINYIHVLDNFKGGRFYILAGGSYKYHQQKVFSNDYLWGVSPWDSAYYCYNLVDDSEKSHYEIEHRWTVGAGPGIEIALSKQVRFSVELPLTYNWKNNIVMWVPQVGLYYYFK